MRSDHLLFLLVLSFLSIAAFSAAARTKGPLVGGWTPIKDIGNPQVAEIARFAVTEYDRQTGSNLKLVKVVSGETQVVAGTNYRLVVAAAHDGLAMTQNYQAVVWEKPWENFRNLTSFSPLNHP